MPAVIFRESSGRDYVVAVSEPIPDALQAEIRAIGGRIVAEAPPVEPGQARREFGVERLALYVKEARELDAIANMTDETDTDEVWDEIWRRLGVGAS